MTPSLTASIVSGVRVTCGPLFRYVEAYRAQLKKLGYAPIMVYHRLRTFAKLNGWLARNRQTARRLNEAMVDRFLADLRARALTGHGAATGLRQLLGVLREAGAIPASGPPHRGVPAQRLTESYRRFLGEERGLDPVTIYHYARHVERFLLQRFGAGPVHLRRLQAREISGFVRRDSARFSRGTTAGVICGLRSFLRFARYRGLIASDLANAVPGVANWALAGVPKDLPEGAVQQVLAHCERTTVQGRRDFAILLLLARLGLRAGEIVALQLEDLDWDNAELTVRSKKGQGWARLPLPADVGAAIARYLERRPRGGARQVFVRDYAPYTPFARSGAVSVLVRRALKRAGVKSARSGAHVFRHTLATAMLRRGASLDEIGRVLRHKDPDTTALYAKVDLTALRALALPWPGGVR